MIVYPPAKINLGLNVTGRRKDGYHQIQTILCPVPLFDRLELSPAKGDSHEFSIGGLSMDIDAASTSVARAVSCLEANYDLPPLKLHLYKNIPSQSGLGGASSDAAYTLKMIDQMFEYCIEKEEMSSYTKMLGADCTFFLENGPAYAEGIGDELTPINLDLSDFHLLLLIPNQGMKTEEAYQAVDDYSQDHDLINAWQRPVREWRDLIHNDFEKVVFGKYPKFEMLKSKLYQSGALYASLSGSGTALYGLYEQQVQLDLPKEVQHFWLT